MRTLPDAFCDSCQRAGQIPQMKTIIIIFYHFYRTSYPQNPDLLVSRSRTGPVAPLQFRHVMRDSGGLHPDSVSLHHAESNSTFSSQERLRWKARFLGLVDEFALKRRHFKSYCQTSTWTLPSPEWTNAGRAGLSLVKSFQNILHIYNLWGENEAQCNRSCLETLMDFFIPLLEPQMNYSL